MVGLIERVNAQCPFSSYRADFSRRSTGLLLRKILFCHALIQIRFLLLLSNIKPHQQVQSAPSQSFPPLANPALSLENWTATTTMNLNLVMTAAENVLRTFHAFQTTQPPVLDSGRCHHHLLALQTVVAAKVPQVKIIFVF